MLLFLVGEGSLQRGKANEGGVCYRTFEVGGGGCHVPPPPSLFGKLRSMRRDQMDGQHCEVSHGIRAWPYS